MESEVLRVTHDISNSLNQWQGFFRFLVLTLTVSNNCACNAARHVGEKSVCIKLKLYKSP